MPKFTVYYTNKEYGSVDVEAETEEQAKEKVETMWEAGDLTIYENKFEVHDADLIKEKMPKYRVDYHYTNYESVIIKADSPEEAQKKVIDCGLNQYETGPNIVDNVEEIEEE